MHKRPKSRASQSEDGGRRSRWHFLNVQSDEWVPSRHCKLSLLRGVAYLLGRRHLAPETLICQMDALAL